MAVPRRGTPTVRLENGKYLCTLCGALLDIPTDRAPLVLIKAASGQPNVRAITLAGEELHRCRLDGKQQ
jgi:hypothetical protein